MKIENSLQKRVFMMFGLYTLFLGVCYSLLVLVFIYVVEDKVFIAMLKAEQSEIKKNYQETGKLDSIHDYISVYTDFDSLPEIVRTELEKEPNAEEVHTESETHFHIEHFELDEHTNAIMVAEVGDFLVVTKMSQWLSRFMGTVFLITLALSLWLAYLLAKRTIKPLKQLTQEVMEQESSPQPLSLSLSSDKSEVGYLARTVETTFNKVKDTLERESNFTRDVSHELRTPITIIKNLVTIKENSAIDGTDLKVLEHSVDNLEKTVDTLLALAREESMQHQEVLVRPVFEKTILSMHLLMSPRNFEVDLQIPDNFKVMGNAHLISLLVTNLVQNAIQYAASAKLTIRLSDDSLVFENTVDSMLDEHIVERSIKDENSQGIGQGLYLVRRIVETLEWQYKLDCNQDKFQFIVLPTSSPC